MASESKATADALVAGDLIRRCDAAALGFATTTELSGDFSLVGQSRAVEAVNFGVQAALAGHNIYIAGPPGTGRRHFVCAFLQQKAALAHAPDDWCYVQNFADARRPQALRLPAGTAVKFAADVAQLVNDAEASVRAAFEGDDYRHRRQSIEEVFQAQQAEALAAIERTASERGIRVMQTPNGLMFAPIENGEVLSPEDFEKLPDDKRATMRTAVDDIGKLFQSAMAEMPKHVRTLREQLALLDRQVAEFAIGSLIEDLKNNYLTISAASAYLAMLETDLVSNYQILRRRPSADAASLSGLVQATMDEDDAPALARYGVNVLISNDPSNGAPVIIEDRPTYGRMIGKVEHRALFGALLTDHHLIQPGALHKANGGYLILNAERLLTDPLSWDALKHALRSGCVRIESFEQAYGLVSTQSLEPEPIALTLKVVLIGSHRLYYLLKELDPEFDDYFKVFADFDSETERDAATQDDYARLIARISESENLLPLAADSVARLIEEASREVEDRERLSTDIRRTADIAREAHYAACQRDAKVIEREDVERAITSAEYRSGRLRERALQGIQRDTLLIDTTGEQIGQINGLAVSKIGDCTFGRPSRITARVSMGTGKIIDIERESELGGALHSKGVMILAGYLNATYSQDVPAAFAATLAFEQSYGGVDGDSASSTELYCLLSALAEIPVRQSLAVTGSVNQLGEIQAIGGVNHKIEGFFDVCAARGLTGNQGVLIPAANVKHLMLRQRVVDAVSAGQFAIYPVHTLDQGIGLLTGVSAGQRDSNGIFPQGTVHRCVTDRIRKFAELRHTYIKGGE